MQGQTVMSALVIVFNLIFRISYRSTILFVIFLQVDHVIWINLLITCNQSQVP